MNERFEHCSSNDGLSNNQVELTRNRIQLLLSNYAFANSDAEILNEVSSLKDFENYLLKRPYIDEDGELREASTVIEKSPELIQNRYDSNFEGYKNANLTGDNSLVSMWAEAELEKDKTLSLVVQDAIFDRINESNLSDDLKLKLIDRMVNSLEEKLSGVSSVESEIPVLEVNKPLKSPSSTDPSVIDKLNTPNQRSLDKQSSKEDKEIGIDSDEVNEPLASVIEPSANGEDDEDESMTEIDARTEVVPIDFSAVDKLSDRVVKFSSMNAAETRTVPEDVAGIIKKIRYNFHEAESEAYALKAYTESLALRERTLSVPVRNKTLRNRLGFIKSGQRISRSELLRAQTVFEDIRDENHKSLRGRMAKLGGFSSEQTNSLLRNQDLQLARFISGDQAETMRKLSKKGNIGKLSESIAKHWANQEKIVNPGIWNRTKSSIKRTAMFAAIGVPAGVVGVFASPVAGIGLGIAGFGVAYKSAAKGIRNWRINKVIETDHTDPKSGKKLFSTVLGAQMNDRYIESHNRIMKAYADNLKDKKFRGPETIADYFTESVEREVKKNRKELSGAMVSFLGGAAASSSFTILGLALAGGSMASF